MTGNLLTRHERCKRRLVLRAGGILGVGAAETQATAARECVWVWWLALQQGALPDSDFRPGHRCQQSLGIGVGQSQRRYRDVAIGAAKFRGEYPGGMPILGRPGCNGETMEYVDED
jgi:hypothetical protein